MIKVSNEKGEIVFNSMAESARVLKLKVNTLYSKPIPFNYAGYRFEKYEHRKHKRDLECTSCGEIKSDTEYYKASKQSEDYLKAPRVNQPCKKCISQKRKQTKTKFYDPKTRIY